MDILLKLLQTFNNGVVKSSAKYLSWIFSNLIFGILSALGSFTYLSLKMIDGCPAEWFK